MQAHAQLITNPQTIEENGENFLGQISWLHKYFIGFYIIPTTQKEPLIVLSWSAMLEKEKTRDKPLAGANVPTYVQRDHRVQNIPHNPR